MKKLILLLLACVWVMQAAPPQPITGPIYNSDGTPYNGTLTIALVVACTQDTGERVESTPPITRSVVGGVITPDLALYPNSTCIPEGTYYTTTYRDQSGNTRNAYWTVTEASNTISDIETDQVLSLIHI